MLPNTFIIGAAKCGTTSLWAYLDAHPEISFSRRKEPAVFIHEDYRDLLDWYESLFRPATIRGRSLRLVLDEPRAPGRAGADPERDPGSKRHLHGP